MWGKRAGKGANGPRIGVMVVVAISTEAVRRKQIFHYDPENKNYSDQGMYSNLKLFLSHLIWPQ